MTSTFLGLKVVFFKNNFKNSTKDIFLTTTSSNFPSPTAPSGLMLAPDGGLVQIFQPPAVQGVTGFGGFQFMLRVARQNIFGCEEAGEVPSDDLLGRIGSQPA